MEQILIGKLIATSAKQIGMFFGDFGRGQRRHRGLYYLQPDHG